mgnify:CR=1 FL=1
MNKDKLFNMLTYEDRMDKIELAYIIVNNIDLVVGEKAAVSVKRFDLLVLDILRWHEAKNSYKEFKNAVQQNIAGR